MATQPQVSGTRPTTDDSLDFEHWPPVAELETDRFCETCGYNLHKQTLRREPRTAVIMIRCPECGRFHPANEPSTRATTWLRRVAAGSLVLWVLVVIALALGLGALQVAASYLTLDELTNYVQLNATGSVYRYRHELELKWYVWGDLTRRYEWYAITGSMSLGLGILGTLIALAVAPHWRRVHHLAFIIAWSVATGAITALIWRSETTRLFRWGVEHIVPQSAVYALGGVLALNIGPPVIRLAVRICLPPRLRAVIQGAWSRVEPITPPSRES